MKTRFAKILSLLLIVNVIMPLSAIGAPPEPPEITVLSSEPEITATSGQTTLDLDSAVYTPEGRVRLIVELQTPPLGLAVSSSKIKLDLKSAASQSYLVDIERQQDMALAEMVAQAPSLQVDFRYQAAFNGFGLRVDPVEALALLKLDSVKHIYPDQMRTLMLDASLQVINAPIFWSDLGGADHAGDGIRIAVIDTGIRSENPMFSGDGFTQPPGFPRGYCADHPADIYFQCNDKLIAARYYVPTFQVHGAEVNSPLDIHGHGSHVAGIVAGNSVDIEPGMIVPETTRISGVAPGAYLMVYKAFFTKPDETAGGTDSMLLAALDDALLDGADVVNNSWGGIDIEDPTNNPFTTAVKALKAAGAVVVFAAGNSGPGAGTISCPGCLEDAITVGATTADRIFANTLDVTGPGEIPEDLLGLAALAGSGPEIISDIEAEVLDTVTVDPLNANACDSFVGDVFSNTIALIPRGDCPFLDKITHVQEAGALAAAVVNNEPGFPIRMANLESTLVPSVFMSQDQGQALLAWVTGKASPTARINASATAVHNVYWQDVLWDSSSVGPNGDPNVLKPDIVAPGVNILSAISPVFTSGENYLILQGTSMATAHISGAAALMRQQHSDWSPDQIKTALTSTAIQQVSQPDSGASATPFMMGSGRLNLGRARNAGVTFNRSSFVNDNCNLQCGWSGVITNVGLSNPWWNAIVKAPSGMHVQLSPAYIFFDPETGDSVPFTVSVDVSELAPDQWYFASVTWENIFGTYSDAYLPIAVYVTDPVQARLEKSVNQHYASPGDIANYHLTLVNEAPLTTTFTITDPIPNNASYVANSATGGLVYDPVFEELRATTELAGAQMQIVTDTLFGAYYSLPDLGAAPIDCPDTNCDDAALVISGLDFYFNGRSASELVWSTNGYLQVGSAILGLSSPNQNLPDTAIPNNIIAPFWTDLDLDGGAGDGSGHGALYYALVQVGEGTGPIYYVFEWKEAALKDDFSSQYSFQVWIERGTEHIWFVYGPQTAALTTGTVGVENLYGSVGFTYFFNGSGIAPVEGTTLKASAILDSAVYAYSLVMGADKSIDVVNTAQAKNQLTDQLLQATTTVFVGDYVFLPLVVR